MNDTYVTQFTRENVTDLNRYIQGKIVDYAREKDIKLDMFVISCSLQQAAYEIMLRSLTENKEQAEAKIEAMLPISQAVTKTIDAYRTEHNSQATEELMGALFGSNIITEFYAHNRDEKIMAMAKAVAQESATESTEVVDEEIVE